MIAIMIIVWSASVPIKKRLTELSGVSISHEVPPTGLEPVHLASEASALSSELRGHIELLNYPSGDRDRQTRTAIRNMTQSGSSSS